MLKPMSEIAGRMSVQIGAQYLEKTHGGRGVLLAGVPGVEPGNVVVLRAGVVGSCGNTYRGWHGRAGHRHQSRY